MRRTRIKICCIADAAEAAKAVSAGVDALGLVSAMPSGPGPIDEAAIGVIARGTPPGVATFLLTSLPSAERIVGQHRRCTTTAIQLVDELPTEDYARLREAVPGVGLVQVVHVTGSGSVAEALGAARLADAVLLDSGDPSRPVKELGGTGRVHDWDVSRTIVERLDRPVYLAGGLTADNVGAAIAKVRPFGVDVCTGVRTAGRLDADKLAAFVHAVNAADALANAAGRTGA